MKLLLDTNVFVRWMAATPLPRGVQRLLARRSAVTYVSIVTGWEIVMKPDLGLSSADVEAGIAAVGASVLPVRFRHLDELSRLPIRDDHRDPFDRMLIAQELAEELEIVTSDTRFDGYKQLRVVWE
jgi:PIN domain nuclease of toxin-antitoxin system